MAKINILVVEDEIIVSKDIQNSLKRLGYSIAGSAASGEKAIEVAHSENPDLILMDVVMPGMNGFQAARSITNESETSSIPIIIVSTKDQETDKMWGLRQGAKDYVTKPADEKELVGKINALLGS